MNKKPIVGIGLIVLLLGSLAVNEAISKKDCINIHVNYADEEIPILEKCIISSEVKALDLLKNNGFTVQGTDKYGDAVLCRLNGLPKPKEESCKEMPPAEAYWAVLVKKDQILFENYAWAQVGINELVLSPGDSLALVFAKDGSVNFPE